MPALPHPLRLPRYRPAGVRRVPPPLAPGARAVVPALRPARARVRALPDLRRLAAGSADGPLGGVARRGRPARRARAQIRRAPSYRRRARGRHGGARAPRPRHGVARPGAARPRAAARPGLQPERAAGPRPGAAVAAPRGAAARPGPGDRDSDGVDTGRAAGECGGSVRRARGGRRRAGAAPEGPAPRLPAAALVRPLILVDDVFTTGATLAAAAGALERAGARTVLAVTFGRAAIPDFS